MLKSRNIYVSFFILSILSSTLVVLNQVANVHAKTFNDLNASELTGREIINKFDDGNSFSSFVTDKPIFWNIKDGDIIDYSPVSLYVNHNYWDELSFYDSNEEYIFEMFVNESTIFNSSYEYSQYNAYFWEIGYDWNVSHYTLGTNLNITVFFYQESDSSLNHSASIGITIDTIRTTPIINFDDFSINLFHWPGSYYSSGYYLDYNPTAANPYYHFKIYQDGYIEFKYGDRELYSNSDLSAIDAQTLIGELISLGYFQMDDAYLAPSYDYLVQSYYQISIDSDNVDVWREAEESMDYFIRPEQFAKCLDAIQEVVNDLYFKPKYLKWELALIIAGSTLGGLGFIAVSVYGIFFIRNRRR